MRPVLLPLTSYSLLADFQEVLESQRLALEKRKQLEAAIKKEQEEAMLNAKKRREEREARKRERTQELKIKAEIVKKVRSLCDR
jgi:hypothetical protein